MFRLQIVLDLAEKKREETERFLAQRNAEWKQAQNQLTQLQQYLTDYQSRGIIQAGGTTDLLALENFQVFLFKLELAIAQQKHEVERRLHRKNEATTVWQTALRKVDAFNVLKQRYLKAEQKRQDQLDQKISDEFAQRQFRINSMDSDLA